MRKFVRLLVILMILTLGTQLIKLPVINLSIFQVFVVAAAVFAVPYVFIKRVRSGLYLTICLLWFASSIVAWIVSINPEWAKSYFLLGLMTTSIFFIIPNLYSRHDIPMLEKWMIRSQYIVLPFSLITALIFYTIGTMPDEIPLPGGMSISLGEDDMARGMAAGEVRLMLPYATPPVLSIVMAMCITLLFFNKQLFSGKVRWLLLSVYTVILIMTGSRSGIMGIIILLGILFVNGEFKSYLRRINKRYVIWGILIILVLLFVALQFEYFQKMILNRFYNKESDGVMEDRHLLVPIDGILIWLGSIKNFIVGIGFGSSALMEGEHTYLPPYFLNSFVTLLAERGFMGLCLSILLLWFAVRLFKLRRFLSQDEKALLYTYIVGLSSALFYENFISYFVIFIIAMVMMLYTCIIIDIRRQRRMLK